MSNLTLVIDDDVLRRARIRALEEGTSVNAIVRETLAHYARTRPGGNADIARFLDLAQQSTGASAAGDTWTRDQLYDRFPLR